MGTTDQADLERHAVCLDVGGTSLKSGVVDEKGTLAAQSMSVIPVDSGGTKEAILESFADALGNGIDYIRDHRLSMAGIGVAICGPFDYEKGISKIKDLDKYESLYDVNVKQQLQRLLCLDEEVPMLFEPDAWAFGRGEIWAGAAKGYSRAVVLTMGTGMGSAFGVDGQIVSEGRGVPWYGWIAGQEYKDGILNDYVSRTFMIRRYTELSGAEIDIEEMADRAYRGEEAALKVFQGMGTTLGEYLQTHNIPEFKPDCLVFGGRISRAFSLFGGYVKTALEESLYIKKIVPAMDIEGSALKGAAKFVFDSV